jgi:hypothetical protein
MNYRYDAKGIRAMNQRAERGASGIPGRGFDSPELETANRKADKAHLLRSFGGK